VPQAYNLALARKNPIVVVGSGIVIAQRTHYAVAPYLCSPSAVPVHGLVPTTVAPGHRAKVMPLIIQPVSVTVRDRLTLCDRGNARDSSVGYQMALLDQKEALDTKERLIRIDDIITSDPKSSTEKRRD
jgi:hypothetical protein